MSDRCKNHGCAAFARQDIKDARRGRPERGLEDYARARGLEFHGRARLAGFRMAQPQWDEEQHNLMRGVLPGGRFGILLHQLLQTHFGGDRSMGGTFWAVRTSSTGGWLSALKPDRTDLPYIGWLLDGGTDDTPREAFDVPGAWAPITAVGLPVPETNALLPRLIILQKSRTAWLKTGGDFDLDDYGAPGFRLHRDERDDHESLTRLVGGPAMPALARLGEHAYAEVRVDHGMLTVRRNGYLLDPAALDDFAQTAAALADAFVAAADTGVPRPPFTDALAPASWTHADVPGMDASLAGAWAQDLRGFAAQHGLALEDTDAWHRAFGWLPLPGRAVAVMRNPYGGRVVFTTDVPIPITRALRGAVLSPAGEGVPDTPPGGIRSEFGTLAVRDGVALAFTHRLFGYTSEAAALIDDALAAMRAHGVV